MRLTLRATVVVRFIDWRQMLPEEYADAFRQDGRSEEVVRRKVLRRYGPKGLERIQPPEESSA